MKPGEVLEAAIWLDGRESEEDRKLHEETIHEAFFEAAQNVVLGPVMWTEKRPGEERVGPVPAWCSGPDVRLLVAECAVLCHQPYVTLPGSFVDELDRRDLERLREITRRAAGPISDGECDAIIEKIGPQSAAKTLQEAVDTKYLN